MLIGVNQGLCWSMTQTAKLDITRAEERGLTVGLNEFSGYVGVAIAGIVTESDVMERPKRSTMDELAQTTRVADKVLVF